MKREYDIDKFFAGQSDVGYALIAVGNTDHRIVRMNDDWADSLQLSCKYRNNTNACADLMTEDEGIWPGLSMY